MGLKCRIVYENNKPVVYNEDGSRSKLYRDALELVGDEKRALDIWAVASSEDFLKYNGVVNTNDEVSLDEVFEFYNSINAVQGKLSPSEMMEVKSFMRLNDVETSHQLTLKLKKIFRSETGAIDFNPDEAIRSGLFTEKDIEDIDVSVVNELINKIEGTPRFEVAPADYVYKYRDRSRKTIFGTAEIIPNEVIEKEVIDLIDNLDSKEEFDAKITNLPFIELVEKYQEDEEFAQEFRDRFSGIVKIPVVEAVGENLAPVSATYATVRNTLQTDIDPLAIESEIDYLTNIPVDIWGENQKNIRNILREVETEMAEYGIDVVGLAKLSMNKPAVLELLGAINQMVQNPTEATMKAFSEKYDELFQVAPEKAALRLEPELKGLSIVRIYSDLSDQQLFEQYGLIKIKENTYHKINKNQNVGTLYEYLYQQMEEGIFKLPQKFVIEKDLRNKEAVLRDIEKYINSRNTGLGFFNEELSLYQVIFNHPTVENPSDTKSRDLSLIKSDEMYLQTEFVSDFYKYILREKLKNSVAYRDVLSKFRVTDKDLVMVAFTDNNAGFEGLEMYDELVDYFRLKKGDSVAGTYLPQDMYGANTFKGLAINYPQEIRELTEPHTLVRNILLTAPNSFEYQRIGDKVYFKVEEGQNNSVYIEIERPKSNVYNSLYMTLTEYNQSDVDALNKTQNLKNSTQDKTPIAEKRRKAGLDSGFNKRMREDEVQFQALGKDNSIPKTDFEGAKNKIFEQNLVEFIKQKGIEVVTDPVKVQEALGGAISPMIVGEVGTTKVENLAQTLTQAKELEKVGKSPEEILKKTGWLKTKDTWKTFEGGLSEGISIKMSMMGIEDTFMDIVDVLGRDNQIFKMYPQLKDVKIKLYRDSEDGILGYTKDREIHINLDGGSVIPGSGDYREDFIGKSGYTTERDIASATLTHELSHLIQEIESFGGGASPNTGTYWLRSRYGYRSNTFYKDSLEKDIQNNIFEGVDRQVANLVLDGLVEAELNNTIVGYPLYTRILGEVEANVVELSKIAYNNTDSQNISQIINSYTNLIGVNLKDLVDVRDINFIQTPAGNVLGFEKNGVIYLDENQLNNVTTLHELIHVYQSMIDIRANKGDKQAQEIKNKRAEVFQEFVDAWKEFHKDTMGVGEVLLMPQFIGEKNKLTSEDKEALEEAKKLESQGDNNKNIYDKTRWLKTSQGEWIREIGDLKFKPISGQDLVDEVEYLYENKEANFPLNTWFDTSEIGSRLGNKRLTLNLKYENSESNEVQGKATTNSGEKIIEVQIKGSKDFLRSVLSGERYATDIIRRYGSTNNERGDGKDSIRLNKTLESVVNHEYTHILQAEGGRKVGNSPYGILDFFYRKNSNTIDKLGVKTYEDLANALGRIYGKEDFMQYVIDIYRNSIGEVQATEVELRLDNKKDTPSDFSGAYNVDINDFISGVSPTNFNILGERGATNSNMEVVNGFYSPLEKIISEAKQDKLPAKQWIEKFAKGEEAKWTGLTNWLSSQQGSISKQDILNFLKENRIEIKEVTKNQYQKITAADINLTERPFGGWSVLLNSNGNRIDIITKEEASTEQEAKEVAIRRMASEDTTKYSSYQLEGERENYKEVLLTAPKIGQEKNRQNQIDFVDSLKRKYNVNTVIELDKVVDSKERVKWEDLSAKANTTTDKDNKYFSSHWDEANILVHLRMNTRTDADGNKVLFLEEVQSDWGQEGKKSGFKQKVKNEGFSIEEKTDGTYIVLKDNFLMESGFKTRQEAEDFTYSEVGFIPQAPFVMDTNTWAKLGLKVALKEAVKQGATKIAWTTGEQQNERYDLSKQVNKIDVEAVEDVDNLFFVDINLSNGTTENLEVENGIIREGSYQGQRLDNVVGKDYADKIMSTPKGESKTLEGADLKVGGKGMKGFYGSPTEGSLGILGNVAKSLFKQEPKTLSFKIKSQLTFDEFLNEIPESEVNFKTTQHSIDITPELKASVEQGQPMFQILGKGGSTKAMEVFEQTGFDLSSPAYAQRPGESDLQYNERLLKEVEAYFTAPKVAEKLENLKKSNPSLWQKIVDFIENLTNYLKGQIGLADYKGNIMDMSKEEYVDALGVSVLKDKYTPPTLASYLSKSIGEERMLAANLELLQPTPTEEDYDSITDCKI